ncbi:peptidoglycan-binding protein [Terrabacter sp. BE26]|uniref:peptidoglycan-binding protein n=1 Tax=Terrabacter sp. BE26 TaxID=2898152 RepID=UPI0035BE9CDB
MSEADLPPVSAEELAAEGGTALPDKEVMSLLDLNADLNLALDVAAPVDLGVAANANVAAPINGAVGANILSVGSADAAVAHQGVDINQDLSGSAVAHAPQHSTIDQSAPATGTGTPTTPTAEPAAAPSPTPTASSALSGNLLNIDVNAAADAKLAAPIDGAVAANANVAAPINASVSANVGSLGSEATSIADQQGSITQHLDGTAQATADQTSQIKQ